MLGRPNVGKSSLVNALAGRKVAIVSPKPQTTRRRIQAVLTTPTEQVILVDTPGLQQPRDLLGQALVRAAMEAVAGVDAVLLVADAVRPRGSEDQAVARVLRQSTAPRLLVVNKIDLVPGAGEETLARVAKELGFTGPTLATSAVTGAGVAEVAAWVTGVLEPGPQYFPDGQVTDQPEMVLVSELIREQVLLRLAEELPHETAVSVEEMAPRASGKFYVRASIVVERESQKAIVIGAGGRQLREIGRAARESIEGFLGEPVFLDLWVRVVKGWRNSAARLREFGYESV